MGKWKVTDLDSGLSLEVTDQEIANLSGGIFMGLGAVAVLCWIIVPFVLALFAPFITLFVLDDFVNGFIAKNALFFLILGIAILALKLFGKTGHRKIVRLVFDAYILAAVLYVTLYVLGLASPVYALIATLGEYLSTDFFDALYEWMQMKGLLAAVEGSWFHNLFDSIGRWLLDAAMWCRTAYQNVDTTCFQQMDILLSLKAIGIYVGLFLLVFVGMIVFGLLGIVTLVLTMTLPYLIAFGIVVLINKLISRVHTAPIRASRKTAETKAVFEQQKAEFEARAGSKFPSQQRTFEAAAELAPTDNAYAQMLLAQCYLHGEGVKEDDRQAFLWYEKAAYHGVTKAQMMTSLFYFNGFGTRKNKLKAKAWLDTAMQDEAFVENVRGKKDTMQKLLRVRKKTRFTDCL